MYQNYTKTIDITTLTEREEEALPFPVNAKSRSTTGCAVEVYIDSFYLLAEYSVQENIDNYPRYTYRCSPNVYSAIYLSLL